jgi:G3E family GTPase
MELSIKTFEKLVQFVDKSKKNKDYELEARFFNQIDEESYNRIFQKFTFNKENNGFHFSYEMNHSLDIGFDKNYNDSGRIRMTIEGSDIKKFWLDEDGINNIEKKYIEKEKIDKLDEKNYGIRFSLNNEIPEKQLLQKNIDLLLSSETNKVYRMKNRYSIKTDDHLFLIDMSSIKMGYGTTFAGSNTIKENLHYEIELEFIGKDSKLTSKEIVQ